MDSRVFWGVLCALLVFTGIAAVVGAVNSRLQEQRQIEAWNAVMQAARDPDPLGIRAQVEARRRQQVLAAAADKARRQLRPGEQCVAGTVVQVNGSTYTQAIGLDGRPVACSGRYRLR